MHTVSVGLAVTPAVVSTLFSHYVHRKTLKKKPTAHLSYDEGFNLVRSFLKFASRHSVEELQGFTAQWVPHPQWVKVEEVEIPGDALSRAADLLAEQLGPEGIRQVGGKTWWQWRKPKSPLRAEWIEMRSDYNERRRTADPGNRVMLYVHGGAYFFGSVDEHRYQMQRHARKLKARAFAPRYRLSPQFPFPCGLQDCLAAYLHLLTSQPPSTIILAGDSAGGGMVLSLLVILRDQGIPLPAGAVLISPWVDLTHSFPSVAGDCPLDYIPQCGFHHKPSMAWPPPNEDELEKLKKLALEQKQKKKAASPSDSEENPGPNGNDSGVPTADDVAKATTRLSVMVDGKEVEIREQIQMYATNELLSHPLVSPIMQPTLGGLPPMLITVGGGEILRDEQIYLAHKCASPADYLPAEHLMDEVAWAQVRRYKPTDVQLQVWEDLCHVAPTLSFTRPAKYMFRSIAQFGAWALARAQKTEIDIPDDDEISVISRSSGSELEDRRLRAEQKAKEKETDPQEANGKVGKAGDPLPPFRNHMIRQFVTRHGAIYPLPPPSELPGCQLPRDQVGVVKPGPVRKWLEQRALWDAHFPQAKIMVHKKRLREMTAGYEIFDEGDVPPPSALAGRRKIGGRVDVDVEERRKKKKGRSVGLSMWALWGSKHDEQTLHREEMAEHAPVVTEVAPDDEGQGARPFGDIEKQGVTAPHSPLHSHSRSRSKRRVVRDESQTGDDAVDENTPVATLLALRGEDAGETSHSGPAGLLSPDYVPDTGVTGKRPRIDGIALPFSLGREAETASMMTLTSAMDQSGVPNSASQQQQQQQLSSSRPTSTITVSTVTTPVVATFAERERDDTEDYLRGRPGGDDDDKTSRQDFAASSDRLSDGTASPLFFSPLATPLSPSPMPRPGLETFVTAEEELPRVEAN